jgi:hypothetical protein
VALNKPVLLGHELLIPKFKTMRRLAVAATCAAAVVLPLGCGGSSNPPSSSLVHDAIGQCAPNAMKGVYWPSRLHDRNGDRTQNDCVTIKGTVLETKYPEPDGDMHIKVLLDPQYRYLLTRGNKYQMAGTHDNLFVLEIIPQHCKTLLRTIYPYNENCADRGEFANPPYPRAGDYIEATGYAVMDVDAVHVLLGYPPGANWAELHPVTALKVLRQGPPNFPNPKSAPEDPVHPGVGG